MCRPTRSSTHVMGICPEDRPRRSRTAFLKSRQYRRSDQQLLDGLTHVWFLRANKNGRDTQNFPLTSLAIRYSAASILGPAASTFAAQNLNSGILPNGSRAGLVRLLHAPSHSVDGEH